MAMNQIPGHNIYIGGVLALKNKAALERASITHIVSVIRLRSDEFLSGYQHHKIDVDDIDDENILCHFPDAVKFIQSGLDSGGSVLVHCAMGKSRSATICIAYLMHQQRNDKRRSITPNIALGTIREGRPFCEPNEGFMEQLDLYYDMACPDDLESQPIYQRWVYRREVEESVACGRAPEMRSVRFEDELPQSEQQAVKTTEREVEIKCRKCRRGIASSKYIISHEKEKRENAKANSNVECAHIFLHPMKWMRSSLYPSASDANPNAQFTGDAPLSGRLACPNPTCGANIGKFAWQGMQCSCKSWVVPAIGLAKARVDIKELVPGNSTPAALGIRLPPGMQPAQPVQPAGPAEPVKPGPERGNL
ncbi:dual specificity phosphatase [Penicillium malachiteum]|nr:dual specificity phosphatase [Penicillium malachiteum]